MPAYVICPHCDHPTVIPAAQNGRRYCCRQCNGHYVIRPQDETPRFAHRNPNISDAGRPR